MIIPPAGRGPAASDGLWSREAARLTGAIALVAAAGGALAAWHYHTLGLTLSHYDARGHLIVARRIVDSITPGWQQIGAVWLPLPHLLNAMPVQIDCSIAPAHPRSRCRSLEYALAAGAIAWIIRAGHRVDDRCGRRRRGVRAQPERALPAVDADDGAAAARDDDGRGGDVDAMALRGHDLKDREGLHSSDAASEPRPSSTVVQAFRPALLASPLRSRA